MIQVCSRARQNDCEQVGWAWYRHGMKTLFSSIVFCGGNPSTTDGSSSQKVSNAELNVFAVVNLNKLPNKQLRCLWDEVHQSSYDVTPMEVVSLVKSNSVYISNYLCFYVTVRWKREVYSMDTIYLLQPIWHLKIT